jgi:hypothetical protein
MAKVISFLSWNVENFHNEPSRVFGVCHTDRPQKPLDSILA